MAGSRPGIALHRIVEGIVCRNEVTLARNKFTRTSFVNKIKLFEFE